MKIKAVNRVVSFLRIDWLNFSDQFQYYNWLNIKIYQKGAKYHQGRPEPIRLGGGGGVQTFKFKTEVPQILQL